MNGHSSPKGAQHTLEMKVSMWFFTIGFCFWVLAFALVLHRSLELTALITSMLLSFVTTSVLLMLGLLLGGKCAVGGLLLDLLLGQMFCRYSCTYSTSTPEATVH